MADVADLKTRYKNGDRDFSDSNFSRANLSYQILRHSKFISTDFSSANLSGTQLENCNFKNSNLAFAILSNADLSGSNLCDANLEGATLDTTKLQLAVYNNATILPQGIDLDAKGAINVDAPEPIPSPILDNESSTQSPNPANQLTTNQKIVGSVKQVETETSQIPPSVPTEYKRDVFSAVPPTDPPSRVPAATPAPTPNPVASDWVQSSSQPVSSPPSSFGFTTPTPTSSPQSLPSKKSNTGGIIFFALMTLTLGYCASQSITPTTSNNQYEPKPTNPFEAVSFPLRACGDAMPTNPNEYPVNLYPVFIDYSSYNLREVTSGYCRDAYRTTRQNGSRAIQVASFLSRDRAQQFAEFLRIRVGSGDVGYPNTFYQ